MNETVNSIDNHVVTVKPNNHATQDDKLSSSSPINNSPFRRIKFHLAKKPFNAFTNIAGAGARSFQLELLNPTNSDNAHNDHSQFELFEPESGGSELDSENSSIRRIGAGLVNLGNTCFLNSVLQCLTYTQPLAAHLQSGKHQITCRNVGFCALCAIQKHVTGALESSGKSLVPLDLVINLRCISQSFRNFRQEDAHEYMVNLLEAMHKCCLPFRVPNESPFAYERSLVHNIFGGCLRSQVKCMQCNYCSNKFEPFLDLSLEILKVNNIYKALAEFTATEELDGGAELYNCQQCKQKVKAIKQLTIDKAPNVLTIHLKRFSSFMPGVKINKKVHFVPTLNLRHFITGPYDGDLNYTLYGVLVHAGWNTHSGHYYCFVRTSTGMWYLLDDDEVIQVSESAVFEQKAYMLFYCRDRKTSISKKPIDVIHPKEIVLNTMGQNNTSGNMENTNGTIEVSAQTDISASCIESCPETVHQEEKGQDERDPSVLREPTTSNKSDEKGQDVDDAMKVDSTSSGNVATVPSTSDGPQNHSLTMNDENEALGTTLIDNEQNSTCESTVVMICSKPQMAIEEPVCVATVPSTSDCPQKHSLMNDEKEALSTLLIEHEEKSICEDVSDSTCVMICSKPQMATEEPVCVATEDISHGTLCGNGGDDSQKGAVTSIESSGLQNMDTFLIDQKVLDQKRHKNMKNHLKVTSKITKFCSNIHVVALLNQRKRKKRNRKNHSKLPIKILPVTGKESGSIIRDKLNDRSENRIENKFNGVLEGVPTEVTEPESSKASTSLPCKNDRPICSLLVSGDRTAPRWDESESTPQIKETEDLPGIGYVGYEWDHEYDRGKRKKLRGASCTEFNGRNGFQDIANERLNPHASKRKRRGKKRSKQSKRLSSKKRRFRK